MSLRLWVCGYCRYNLIISGVSFNYTKYFLQRRDKINQLRVQYALNFNAKLEKHTAEAVMANKSKYLPNL